MDLNYIVQHLVVLSFLKNIAHSAPLFTLAARELKVKSKATAFFLPSLQTESMLLILTFFWPKSLLLYLYYFILCVPVLNCL